MCPRSRGSIRTSSTPRAWSRTSLAAWHRKSFPSWWRRRRCGLLAPHHRRFRDRRPPVAPAHQAPGPGAARLWRQQAVENARMNALLPERLNVQGALLFSLAGRPDQELEVFANKAADCARRSSAGTRPTARQRFFRLAGHPGLRRRLLVGRLAGGPGRPERGDARRLGWPRYRRLRASADICPGRVTSAWGWSRSSVCSRCRTLAVANSSGADFLM